MQCPVHCAEYPIGCKMRHSCLTVSTQETSSTFCGATYLDTNTMELRHSCLIVARMNAQNNAWSNPLDAKQNGTKTFMFDSRDTWNIQYHAGSNLRDACVFILCRARLKSAPVRTCADKTSRKKTAIIQNKTTPPHQTPHKTQTSNKQNQTKHQNNQNQNHSGGRRLRMILPFASENLGEKYAPCSQLSMLLLRGIAPSCTNFAIPLSLKSFLAWRRMPHWYSSVVL